jgi:hypothetical protein
METTLAWYRALGGASPASGTDPKPRQYLTHYPTFVRLYAVAAFDWDRSCRGGQRGLPCSFHPPPVLTKNDSQTVFGEAWVCPSIFYRVICNGIPFATALIS